MVGEAHALNDINEKRNAQDFVNKRIDIIEENKELNEIQIAAVRQTHNNLIKKLKIDFVLEIADIHQRNFQLDNDGKLFFVDEEGFLHRIKGMGLAKPLLIARWLTPKEQKNAFWKGYHEHASSDFFDKDYQKYIYFVGLVQAIATRLTSNKGADFSKEKKELLELIG